MYLFRTNITSTTLLVGPLVLRLAVLLDSACSSTQVAAIRWLRDTSGTSQAIVEDRELREGVAVCSRIYDLRRSMGEIGKRLHVRDDFISLLYR